MLQEKQGNFNNFDVFPSGECWGEVGEELGAFKMDVLVLCISYSMEAKIIWY